MSNRTKPNKKKVIKIRSHNTSVFLLFPLILIVTVLPLIVKMRTYHAGYSTYDWFTANDVYFDFFLYYKQWFFVAISGFMLVILSARAYMDKKVLIVSKTFIPLASYAFLSLLSTLLSKYRIFGFTGAYEQFENVFALLGYALIVYYTFLTIESEEELKLMINFLTIGALLLTTIGAFQAFGLDFFNSSMGKSMIVEKGTRPEEIVLEFGKGRVYATLYNPNYVGVYTSMIISIYVVLLYFSRRRYETILYALVIITSVISMYGSESKAGLLSLIACFFLIILFLRRPLLKRWFITIPIAAAILFGLIVYENQNDYSYFNAIKNGLKPVAAPALTDITLTDENVQITYNENTLYASLSDNGSLVLMDEENNLISQEISESDGTIKITDKRFTKLKALMFDEVVDFGFYINNKYWLFSYDKENQTYTYLNRYGRFSPIETAPSVLFNGYEKLASNRGFLWSRSIPLLPKYLLLGSGADTYANAFPQYDYVAFANFGYNENLITKPHSMYFQIGIQTGVLSLISLLLFYGLYFIKSVKLYINNQFDSNLSRYGLALFIGSIGYMISGITNDSSISVAPVFWVILGLGVTTNHMYQKLKKEQ